MLMVQRGSFTHPGASLPPLQPIERRPDNTLEDSGKGDRLESGQIATCADVRAV